MNHAVQRLSSRLSLSYADAYSKLEALKPSAFATASLLTRSGRRSRSGSGRFRFRAVVDGVAVHLIYDPRMGEFVTAFEESPGYRSTKPVARISEVF